MRIFPYIRLDLWRHRYLGSECLRIIEVRADSEHMLAASPVTGHKTSEQALSFWRRRAHARAKEFELTFHDNTHNPVIWPIRREVLQ